MSNGGFRFVIDKYYFGEFGRSLLPDVLANSYLDTTICDRWLHSVSIECREVRKMKRCIRTTCPFCVRIVFDRAVGSYIVKVCMLSHLGHVVNLSSIIGHVKFESDLSVEERSQLVNFGKIGFTGLQSKTSLCRLFSNRIYDSDMIYRVCKQARYLQYSDATDCMLKLVELVNYHKPKGNTFEMVSDRGGRLETLHWVGSFSSLFIEKYSDFVLIDGTHKTDIYDLSLVVTTVVDSLGVAILDSRGKSSSFENWQLFFT